MPRLLILSDRSHCAGRGEAGAAARCVMAALQPTFKVHQQMHFFFSLNIAVEDEWHLESRGLYATTEDCNDIFVTQDPGLYNQYRP